MKKMRKMKKIFMGAVLLSIFATGCGASNAKLPGKFEEETVKEEAMKSIEYFNKRDYQGILDMGSEELRQAITAEGFAEQSNPYLDKRGAFKEISKTLFVGNEDKNTGKQYGGVVMIGEYEEGKIQFTIGFDEEMEIVQFTIK